MVTERFMFFRDDRCDRQTGHLNHYKLSLSLCPCVLDDNRIEMLSWNHAANLQTDRVRQFA